MAKENWNQYKDLEYYPDRFCACGCGGRIKVKPWHRWDGIPNYIRGHARRGKHHTREAKEKLRKANEGKKMSEESNQKNREAHSGPNNSNWIPRETRICACGCKGTFECKITSKQRYISGHNSKNGMNNSICVLLRGKTLEEFYGVEKAIEMKQKNREAHLGKTSSKKGKTYEEFYGEDRAKEIKQLHKRKQEENWQDLAYIVAQRKSRQIKPNKSEKFLMSLLQELFPNEWKYVGDFSVWIGRANPDFINANGRKKVVEFFGGYYHSKEKTGRTKVEEEQRRTDHFAKYGYHTLIIWEHELDDLDVLKLKLFGFNKEK